MNLKSILKLFKLNESTISMILGAIVIVVVGLLVVNYFKNRDTGTTIPGSATTSTEEISLPTTHTVQKGESLWSISEKYYKSGYNWVDIAKENNLQSANDISEGQELKIPDVEAKNLAEASPSAPQPTPEKTITPTPIISPQPSPVAQQTVNTAQGSESITGNSYTVVKGDNLWNIAVRAYGDGFKWIEIARANKLVNPGLIHAGNVFTIPR